MQRQGYKKGKHLTVNQLKLKHETLQKHISPVNNGILSRVKEPTHLARPFRGPRGICPSLENL